MIFSAEIVVPVTSVPIVGGAVAVENGRIVAVGARRDIVNKYSEKKETYFENAIIMPGLVNLHGHLECSSFEDLAQPAPFGEWLGGIIKASSEMDREGWLSASREGIRRYFEAGITCTADITRSGTGLQAIIEAGIPAVIYLEVVAVDRKNLADILIGLLERIKGAQVMSDAGWHRIGLSPHSPYTLSGQALEVCAQLAKEYELPLTTHLAETIDELNLIRNGKGPLAERIGARLELEAILNGGLGKTPAEFLNENGLLVDTMIAAHGVCLSESDVK
ncbi:MAG: amidohydrolase family protein, partial [Rubrobacteridae bacterium]|nr:amidohydrolase family protein [Rubrobacteridae bacterium]